MAYTTLDITAIPSPLRIFIDEASALCKRHNTNVIEPLHLIAAIVRTRGAVLFHDCECQYNAIFTTLNSHLDSCGKTPEPGMFIDAELLDIIRELADTSTTTAALFLSLLKKTHDKVPDDLKSYIASLADNIQSTQEPEPAATPHSTDTATQSPPMQDTTITIGQMPFSAPAVAPNAEPEKKPLRQPYITYWDAHFIASFPHAIVGRDALLKKIVPVLLRRVDPA
ncbi:MAG: hypothetical protein N3B18_01670, partial [Desulfobacterota bacterium]|nr:hypothetical protein [Thermodesulfobacteriota bacterium]